MLRLAALLLFVCSAPVAADPGPMLVGSGEARALLDEGRAEMTAFRLAAAERVFQQMDALEGGSVAARFHLAKIAWWRAITMEQGPLYEAFGDRASATLSALDEAPSGPWTNHFRAELELFRSTIHAKQGEYGRAALALRRSYLAFQRNARDHPNFLESRWGIGLGQVVVGSVPRRYRWILNVLGFRGTVSGGMAEIRASADHARFYRDEAAVYYAILDQVINESRGEGIRYLQAVQARNPRSPQMMYLLGFGLLGERRADDAEAILLRAVEAQRRDGVYPIPYVDYYLAEAHFRQNRFGEAARGFERFLDRFPGRAHRAQAHLKAGLAWEMMGQRERAVRHYSAVQAREDFDSDAAAEREAAARMQSPLSESQRELLRAQNAFDGGRYPEAISLVQRILTDQRAPAIERSEAAYRSGRAYQQMEQWQEALRHFQFAVSNPGDPLAKWGPWSQFYIGEVHRSAGDRDAAREAYQRALANRDPFEYYQGLEQRARAALERL